MMSVEPLYALGIFTVTKRLEIFQTVIYEYYDPDQYYAELAENVEDLENELEEISTNMQEILDQEEVVINGEKVKPKVTGIDLGFKGTPEEPFLAFFIYFKGKPRKGLNYYENIYSAERSEYPYTAYWYFPHNFQVTTVQASGISQIINDHIVVIRVEEGERISGYEKIEFEI